MSKHTPHVMAVSSAGGHFEQLLRLRPSWANMPVTYVTTDPLSRVRVMEDANPDGPKIAFKTVVEANRWQKFRLLRQFLGLLWIIVTTRPDVIITTGAAPGGFALVIGRVLRIRTVWVDSMANADQMSGTGEKVRRFADLWLTQWAHLATEDGPDFRGTVL